MTMSMAVQRMWAEVELTLRTPNRDLLPSYVDALKAGWSPDNLDDVSTNQLAAIERDPDGFLRDLTACDGTMTLPDGQIVDRLPTHVFWIYDPDFCGRITFRFQPGTEELPSWAFGHVGCAIVPWKRRRGYATKALRTILPIARAEGLKRIYVVAAADNIASQRVFRKNGARYDGEMIPGYHREEAFLGYWLET